jgi:hypothetical protein|eukprot:scaffold3217_cov221-Alexandrium_tamarense.AAC.12
MDVDDAMFSEREIEEVQGLVRLNVTAAQERHLSKHFEAQLRFAWIRKERDVTCNHLCIFILTLSQTPKHRTDKEVVD